MSLTEAQNPNTLNLDQLSSLELVQTFVKEDQQVLRAIKQAENEIAQAIEIVYKALDNGGRLFYYGAGTSGRMGILDAVECPPTFSTEPELVQAVIAGGDPAIKKAVEGAEDDEAAGYKSVAEKLSSKDVLVGIAASGSTPFVIGALKAAKDNGIASIAIANNPEAKIFQHAEQKIFLETGPEVLSGSTRLKAGTSQKMVLNIISTSTMVKLGKVYGNLMVDLKASNEKLVKRAEKLVMKITNCDLETAQAALKASKYKVKNAVLIIKKDIDNSSAEDALKKHKGFLSQALEEL